MPEGALWDPGVQTLPRADLRALQEERLRATVARAWEMPFWRAALERAGLASDDVKTVEDLRRVPRTTKDELRGDQRAHPPFGSYQSRDGAVRVGTSTGTTGEPTLILWGRRDLAVEHAAAARMFWRFGLRPGALVTHSHPLGVYGGGAILSSALEEFGAIVMAVGAPSTDTQAETGARLFERTRPDMYMMLEAGSLRFVEAAQRIGIEPGSINLGVKVDHPAIQRMSASAGNECFSFLGGGCTAFKGAHVCEDLAIVECVDAATGEPVPDGEKGMLVVTTLERDNPMLRYECGDIVRLETGPCDCPETHTRMSYEGRAADIVRIGSVEVLPVDVWWALEDFPQLRAPSIEFQIVRRPAPDALEIRVEGDPALAPDIAARVTERTAVPARVEMVEHGTLPRFEFKPVRVVDAG